MSDAQNPRRWERSLSRARVLEQGKFSVLTAGSHLWGEPYTHRVYFEAPGRVERIELVRPRGTVARALSFSDYQGASGTKGWFFPRHIVDESFDGKGEIVAKAHYVIRHLAINTEIDSEIFTLPMRSAAVVVDEDKWIVLKHPQLKPSEWAVDLQ